ncbi:hypothetical protein QR680_001797 [Steinernema hermaphroditum]|uniref:Nephrin n=1 Tax=Steinernema hermaphroditum TaxID=289476 RepID=A0AA39GZX0_9BILA|nr:hypothetical protein QR680_001797 [Steinernema hermaphroditum]
MGGGNSSSPCFFLLFVAICYSLQLLSFASSFELKEAPRNTSVLIGSDVTFRCTAPTSVSGNPLKSQWRTNAGTLLGHHEPGVLAGYGGRYSYEKETPDELNLKIQRITLEDDGKFECQMLRSDEGSMRGAAYLNVLVKPSVVYFMNYRQGDVIEVSEDQTVNITCVVPNVKPAPKTEWYINGKLISDNNSNLEKYNLNKTVTSFSSLYWKPSRLDHKKVLTCQAEHAQTLTSLRASVSLSVLYSSERPRISVVGDSENIRAGQNVTLLCSAVGGNPLPNVTWYFNRHYIESPSYYDSSTQETINRYSFIADPKDNGAEYECRSHNRHNVAPLRGSVRLKVSFPAPGVDVYGDSSIRRGDRATVTCRTKPSNPASRISFAVNGSPSQEPEQHEEVVSNGIVTIANFTIDFHDQLVRNHEITVDCTARNSEGTVTKQHVIRILSPPMQPLVYGFEHGPMLEGERLNLTCESHGGNPLAALSWYRGVEKLKQSRSSVTGDVSQSYISIPLDRTLNRAPIRCEATNDALDHALVASKKVIVLFPPKKVSIRPLQGERIVSGNTAKLACLTSSSNPESAIEWNFHGKDVRWRSETVQNNSSGEFHGFEVENIIMFEATEELDSSLVTCTASHPHWTKQTTATYTINVLYPPKIVADGVINVVIGEGESFRENLTVFANPPVSSWKWRRNGIHFQDAIGSIFARGAMLTGRSVTRNDAGIYTVFASNQIGSSNATIRLSVEFPAHVTHITQSVYANTGEDVELECVVEAFPRKKGMVRWLKGGKELPSVIRDERRAALRVNASEESSGEYVCIADNGLGPPQLNKTYLLVNKAPTVIRHPAFSRAAAAPGGRAKIICRADAVPDCKFTWKLDNDDKAIESNTSKYSFYSRLVGISTYESVLSISDVNSQDYMKRIRCTASNRYGRDEVLIPLGPLTTPDLPFEITVANFTDESVAISWMPGFDGGSPQSFEVSYRVAGGDTEYQSMNTSDSTMTIYGLPPGRTVLIQLRAMNQHGFSSEFSEPVRAVTSSSVGLNVANAQEATESPKFVLIIFAIALFLLLLVNCLLVVYLRKRQKIKKIQEKTEIMYGTMALTPQEIARRAESEMASRCDQHLNDHCGSEDDHSVRTMIEVNPNGCMQQIGPQFFDSNCLVDYEFDPALYSDIVRSGPPPIDSSYLVGPHLDECPSIDETYHHDLFSDFNTTQKNLSSTRFRRQALPSNHVKVFSLDSNVSISDRVVAASHDSRLVISEKFVNVSVWSTKRSVVEFDPNDVFVNVSAEATISHFDVSSSSFHSSADSLTMSERTNRSANQHTMLDAIATGNVSLSFTAGVFSFEALHAKRAQIHCRTWQSKNPPHVQLSSNGSLGSPRLLEIKSKNSKGLVDIILEDSKVLLRYGGFVLVISADYRTVSLSSTSYNIEMRTVLSSFTIDIDDARLELGAKSEKLKFIVAANSSDAIVEAKHLSRLTLNEHNGSVVKVTGAPLDVKFFELIANALQMEILSEQESHVRASTNSSQLTLTTNTTKVQLTSAHHTLDVLGGSPNFLLLRGNISITLEARANGSIIPTLLPPFKEPANKFMTIGPDQNADIANAAAQNDATSSEIEASTSNSVQEQGTTEADLIETEATEPGLLTSEAEEQEPATPEVTLSTSLPTLPTTTDSFIIGQYGTNKVPDDTFSLTATLDSITILETTTNSIPEVEEDFPTPPPLPSVRRARASGVLNDSYSQVLLQLEDSNPSSNRSSIIDASELSVALANALQVAAARSGYAILNETIEVFIVSSNKNHNDTVREVVFVVAQPVCFRRAELVSKLLNNVKDLDAYIGHKVLKLEEMSPNNTQKKGLYSLIILIISLLIVVLIAAAVVILKKSKQAKLNVRRAAHYVWGAGAAIGQGKVANKSNDRLSV